MRVAFSLDGATYSNPAKIGAVEGSTRIRLLTPITYDFADDEGFVWLDQGTVRPWPVSTGHVRSDGGRIDMVDMGANERTHVRKPVSVDGDFMLLWEDCFTAASAQASSCHTGFADTDYTSSGFISTLGNAVYTLTSVDSSGITKRLYNTTNGANTYSPPITLPGGLNVRHFSTLSRVGSMATLSVYSDEARQELIATVSLSCNTATLTQFYPVLAYIWTADRSCTGWIDNIAFEGYSTAGETATLEAVDLGVSREINETDLLVPVNPKGESGTVTARRKLDDGAWSEYQSLFDQGNNLRSFADSGTFTARKVQLEIKLLGPSIASIGMPFIDGIPAADLPAEDKVEYGVSYDNGLLTGTLQREFALPLEVSDVTSRYEVIEV